ncbi:MAG: ATP-binding cassette domain-containing protein [bacterium]
MPTLLALRDITKQYANTLAVNHVSLEIPRQSIFGLLGPNGAGKTSLIRIITQITVADSGEILFDGEKLRSEHTSQIGYMPEERGLYKRMRVGEQLLYLAQLKGLSAVAARKKIGELFERFSMENWWKKKVEELSKGMQQKVQFIATILHEPKLLILDEPFTGLDPINADLITEEIHRLRDNGATIIFSTHRMEQVEELCDNIALINHGKKILEGKVIDIRQQFKKQEFSIRFAGMWKLVPPEWLHVKESHSGEVIVNVSQGKLPNDILRAVINDGIQIVGFNELLPSIHDIFISLVKGDEHA